jgi:hypothetical protein
MSKIKNPFRQHRFLFHPVFSHMSRIVFTTFLSAAFLYGGGLFVMMRRCLAANGVFITVYQPWLLELVMSGWFAVCFIFTVGLLAAVITSHYIKGPVERIQDWLLHWQAGNRPSLLRVRVGDPYEKIIRLINELTERISPHETSR